MQILLLIIIASEIAYLTWVLRRSLGSVPKTEETNILYPIISASQLEQLNKQLDLYYKTFWEIKEKWESYVTLHVAGTKLAPEHRSLARRYLIARKRRDSCFRKIEGALQLNLDVFHGRKSVAEGRKQKMAILAPPTFDTLGLELDLNEEREFDSILSSLESGETSP